MLTPDECLSFLKMQMDRFLETDPDKQDEFGDPVETIARLSFDVSRGESLVEKDVRQINFDLYAETFRENHTVSSSPSCDGQNESVDGEQHEILRPSSCDGLSKSNISDNFFCFVEYKNGNIVAYDQKTGVYTIKQKPAQEIERKLNDSAYMLECDGVISAEVLGRHFGVIVVVRDERVQRQKDCMVSVGPNPLLMHIQDSVREFKLHKGISASESRYS